MDGNDKGKARKGDKGLGKGRTMEETIHEIQDLVNERAHSRWGHDFTRADSIQHALRDMGVQLDDWDNKTSWSAMIHGTIHRGESGAEGGRTHKTTRPVAFRV